MEGAGTQETNMNAVLTHTHTMGCLSCEDAFFALAGCLQPTNTTDRGCGSGPTGTYYHISLDGWTLGEGGENDGR